MATKHHQPAMAEIDDQRNEPTCHKSINYASASFEVNSSAKAKSTYVSNFSTHLCSVTLNLNTNIFPFLTFNKKFHFTRINLEIPPPENVFDTSTWKFATKDTRSQY